MPAQAASVSHRIAFGPHAGQPVRRLRAGAYPWPSEEDLEVSSTACVAMGGYSVHAATAVKAREREKHERLVRYMARPAIADNRIVIENPHSLRLRKAKRPTEIRHRKGKVRKENVAIHGLNS